jgi:hypothetical protein
MLRPSSVRVLACATLLFLTACQKAPDQATQAADSDESMQAAPAVQAVTVPEGTGISVRLVELVGSARSRAGDAFHATVAESVVVNNAVVIPSGASVTGRVIAAQPSGRLKSPAELTLTLISVELDNKEYDIHTSDYSRRGPSHAKRNAGWIGGAAAGGALVGALAGGKKGALIGAGAGAGGGTAAAYATGKKDITLPSETVLRFTLRQPLALTRGA